VIVVYVKKLASWRLIAAAAVPFIARVRARAVPRAMLRVTIRGRFIALRITKHITRPIGTLLNYG